MNVNDIIYKYINDIFILAVDKKRIKTISIYLLKRYKIKNKTNY